MSKVIFTAWAINVRRGFLGRYWWFKGNCPKVPTHLEGCQIAFFCTRKLAREALRYEKVQNFVAYPKSKVSKVKVTIEESK